MKTLIFVMLCFLSESSFAQTKKELIGKWKLVKETKNGQTTVPKETYQIFNEDGKFTGINDGKSRNGKWKLSEDGKKLNISMSIISINFEVEYFDPKKRIIKSEKTGVLEYQKVDD